MEMSKKFLKEIMLSSDQYAQEKDYWLTRLSGELVRGNFPYDRFAATEYVEQVVPFQMSDTVVARLLKLSNGSDQRLHMILVTAVSILLNKYTGLNDLLVGTPIFKQVTDAEFINTILVLRSQLTKEMSFKKLLLQIKDTLIEAVDHQNYPVEQLIDLLDITSPGIGFPIFDVAVMVENIHAQSDLAGVNPNLVFSLARINEQIEGKVIYNSGLYQQDSIVRFMGHFTSVLEQVLMNLDIQIQDIEILSETEKHQLLAEFNDTKTAYPKEKTLQALFEEQVANNPDQVAVKFSGESVTYGELNERANQLAWELRNWGVKANTVVGMLVERSIDMMVGIWGILKAGGAYLPIDPGYPLERIYYMLEDSETELLLTHRGLDEQIDFQGEIIDLDTAELYQRDTSNLEQINTSEDTVYIVYTSGTTGLPKGILTKHHNVSRVVKETNYIEITPKDRILQLSNYAFDGSVFDMFGAHLNGARLVMLKKEDILEINKLAETIRSEGITIFFVTTALFNTLVDTNLEALQNIRKVLFGGERISVPHAARALDFLGEDKMIHVYGPTESTVYATYYFINEVDPKATNIPIGKPLANTEIFVLDQELNLVPIGATGELCITGDGLANGYLKRPELTMEKFVDHPFGSGEKLYRTGDLVRLLPDGNIEFIGRVDHQVKIRGFRIELGEIQAKLLNYDLIKEAIVVVTGDSSDTKSLCAYFVGEAEIDLTDLREFLAQDLPEYMIPLCMIQLKKMPLTPNGKIDRKALPEPDGSLGIGMEYVAPRDQIEEKLVAIWEEILKIEGIGIRNDFFELGGHSLKATTLVSKIHKELNINVPLREIFQRTTVEAQSEYIRGAEESIYYAIEPLEEAEYYPVSSAQKRVLVLNKIEGDNISYNMPTQMTIQGALDWQRFQEAFKALVDRHEILRTSFAFIEGEAIQKVHPEIDFTIEYLKAEQDKVDEISQEFIRPFILCQAPLLRVKLIQTAPDEHIFLFDMHHIISDGTSMGILIRDFVDLYQGNDLPELRIQYKDFSAWQNQLFSTDLFQRQEVYWVEQFADEVPILNLPTDYPRPKKQSFDGAKVQFELDEELTTALRQLTMETDTTLFMVLLAAYNILLYKYSGQEDIVVGTPISGRRHSDLENLIGMFINTLSMRNYPKANLSFNEFLTDLKKRSLQAYENQDYQFETLVSKLEIQRDMSRNPLFDVMFILQNMEIPEIEMNELKFIPSPPQSKVSKVDLTLQAEEKDNKINLLFEYATKLFKKETIERMAEHYITIIKEIIVDPEMPIFRIDSISAEDRQRISEFNTTETEYPHDKTIHQLFEGQVQQSPDLPAVIFKDQVLTYKELNEKANQLARELRLKGVTRDTLVGLMVKRSPEMFIGILAVLKAGGAYLPIDPEYPETRIKYVLEDSNTEILLTQESLLSKIEFSGQILDLTDERLYSGDVADLDPVNTANDLAYIIYTSGSTGNPKGVMIEHQTVCNFIQGITDQIEFTPEQSILALTTISFDIFVLETLLPLTQRTRIVIADEAEQLDPHRLNDVIINNQIDMLQITPSRMKLLLSGDDNLSCLKDLQVIMLGGEALPEDLLAKLIEVSNARIFNMYGPTEATVWSTMKELTNDDKVTIGAPIANTQIYIIDESQQLQPIGVAGELCIAGAGLSRGYLNQSELTAEKFIPNPFKPGERMYKTGDRARWLADGNIDFLGRIDHQVKIRGFRIELGEIESVLLQHDQIDEAVVVAKQHKQNIDLAAYIVATQELTVHELRDFLVERLPVYMVPSFFIQLDEFPLTPNGKIDRKKLPEPDMDQISTDVGYIAPVDEIEEKLVAIWKSVLEVEKIGIENNFFELGGNSILLIQTHTQLEKEFPGKVTVTDFFSAPTIKKLAEQIRNGEDKSFKDIKIPLLELPESYFGAANREDCVEVRFQLAEGELESLNEIAVQEEVELNDIFIAMYIYLFAEITEESHISIQTMVNQNDLVHTFDLGLDVMESITDLLKLVHQKGLTLHETDSYQLRDIDQIILTKDSLSIVPFFYHEELLTEKVELTELYDLILMVDLEEDQVVFELEYNGQRLRKESMIEFINGYMRLMEVLMESYALV